MSSGGEEGSRDDHEQSPPTTPPRDTSIQFPLNSRRLTIAHLKTIARALGMPGNGTANELRQCIEGQLWTDRGTKDVVIIVKESPVMEQVLVLADATGEFLESEPTYLQGHGTD